MASGSAVVASYGDFAADLVAGGILSDPWVDGAPRFRMTPVVLDVATARALRTAAEEIALAHDEAARICLDRTDLVEGPLRDDCARGYLPADNPILPGESGPVDVTEIDVPFHQAGGGVVSTPADIARMLRALLRDEFLPDRLRTEMLRAVESDWPETDRYGLGLGEITALMDRQRSPCGPAWGHIGFAVGYTAMALSSEDGERQVVICANGSPSTQPTFEAFWDAVGGLAWRLYCM